MCYTVRMSRSTHLLRIGLRGLLSAIFLFTGTMHFVKAEVFVAIMPPYLPYHRALVAISGVCEIAGALGILAPVPLRRWAGWGLILLLIAVFSRQRSDGAGAADHQRALVQARSHSGCGCRSRRC